MIGFVQRFRRLTHAVGLPQALKISLVRILWSPVSKGVGAFFAYSVAERIRKGPTPIIVRSTLPYLYPYRQRVHHITDALVDAGETVLFLSPDGGYDRIILCNNPRPGLYLTAGDSLIQHFPEAPLYLLSSDGDFDDLDVAAWLSSGRPIIYDYLDHFDDALSSRKISSARERAHDSLLRNEHRALILCSARALLDEVAATRARNFVWVPNGAEIGRFKGTVRTEHGLRPDFYSVIRRGRPILGYYGALAHWFDYDLILHIGRTLTDCDIVILGLDLDGSSARAGGEPNIFVLPAMSYEDLPRHAAWFDVCLIPFVLNKITTATSPLKMFEYMALGRPTVTTALPDCMGFDPVLVAVDAQDFMDKTREALKLTRDIDFPKLAFNEARNHDWSQRVAAIARSLHDIQQQQVTQTWNTLPREASSPSFSAIVPVFNRSTSAQSAIRSILAQGIVDLEIIVVDDGSDPPLVLSDELAIDPRVRLIRSEINEGAAAARNRGVREASREWLAFLDSDDVWMHGKLATQAELSARQSGPLCIVSGFRRIKSTSSSHQILFPRNSEATDDFAAGCWYCPGSTAIIHRSVFDIVGFFDEKLRRLEDSDWYLRFGLAGGTVIAAPIVGSEVRIDSIPFQETVDDACRYLFGKWIFSNDLKLTIRQKRLLAAYLFLEKASVRHHQRRALAAGWMLFLSLLLAPRIHVQIKNWWKQYDVRFE